MNGKGFRIPRQSNVNTFTIYYETAVNNEPPLLLESLCAQRCGGPNPNKMEKPLSRWQLIELTDSHICLPGKGPKERIANSEKHGKKNGQLWIPKHTSFGQGFIIWCHVQYNKDQQTTLLLRAFTSRSKSWGRSTRYVPFIRTRLHNDNVEGIKMKLSKNWNKIWNGTQSDSEVCGSLHRTNLHPLQICQVVLERSW